VTSGQPDARQRILDAAVRRIAQEGLDDARIARIAMDAGVSAALVHYHFASRDALLAEALEHSYEMVGELRMDPPDATGGAAETLGAMIEQCLPLPGAQRDDWLLWIELWLRAARDAELRPTAAQLYGRLQKWFTAAIAAGVESGEFATADPAAAADLLIALIDGYGVRALASGAPDARPVRDAVWRAAAAELGLEPAP
jgi:AcrR family transcriptional regulator